MPRYIRPGSELSRTHRAPSAHALYKKMYLPGTLREKYKFLIHARSKRFFFETLAAIHPKGTAEYALAEKAYVTLKRVTKNRYRDSGEPESEHPIRCALTYMIVRKGRDADKISARLLHDITETFRDTWPTSRIERKFNAEVARLVAGVTKPPKSGGLETADQVDRAFFKEFASSADADVVELKGDDRFDNSLTLWGRSIERQRKNVSESITILIPMMNRYRLSQVRDLKAVVVHIAKKDKLFEFDSD